MLLKMFWIWSRRKIIATMTAMAMTAMTRAYSTRPAHEPPHQHPFTCVSLLAALYPWQWEGGPSTFATAA